MKNKKYITLNYGKRQIATKDIKYIEGDGNYSNITYGHNNCLYSSFTVKVFFNQLHKKREFFMARKGLILNLNYLSAIFIKDGCKYAKMLDGKLHSLSRRKGKELLSYISNEQFNITIKAS